MSDNQKLTLAYVALIVAIVATSLSAIFVRWADAPGPVTVFYRSAIAMVLLFPFYLQKAQKNRETQPSHIKWIFFGLLGGIMIALDQSAWSTSVNLTKVANATYFNSLAPLWVALFALIVWKERLSRIFWSGLAMTLIGVMLIVGLDLIYSTTLNIGDLLGILSSIFFGGYFIVTQYARRNLDALKYTWLATTSCAVSLFFVNLLLGYSFTDYPPRTWFIFILAALVNQIIGYFSMSYALGKLPASIVSPSTLAKPVLVAILAIPLFGETMTFPEIIGGIFVLTGIYLINKNRLMK